MEFDTLDLRQDTVQALAHLRKESLDLYNRIHSIEEDTSFVDAVHAAYLHLPILPNLRCGAWYVNPEIASKEPAYFKSTDGHFGAWSFNLRRPNLHLLGIIMRDGGLVLVDSTRAGKRIPDALAKTVPIWCTVVNRAVRLRHPKSEKFQWNAKLYCPPGAVSPQEQAQIEVHLDTWAQALFMSSYDLPDLSKPIRPLWITPSTSVFPRLPSDDNLGFLPVICVSASKQIQEGIERRSNGFAYVQGSGDDHELWGMGLTPELYWAHRDEIIRADRADLSTFVTTLVSEGHDQARGSSWAVPPTPVQHVGGLLSLAALADLPSPLPSILPHTSRRAAFVVISPSEGAAEASLYDLDNVLRLQLASGKNTKAQLSYLADILPRSTAFIGAQLSSGAAVCVCCATGADASIGVALAALQLFFDDAGTLRLAMRADVPAHDTSARPSPASKQSIGTRLQWIIASRPHANPARATLKRVHEFLLSAPAFRRQRTAV